MIPPRDDIDHCNSNFLYCYLGDGYRGRDRGDDEGIPNDGETRVAYGIYPGGGAYDPAGTQAEETAIAEAAWDASSGVSQEAFVATTLETLNPITVNTTNLGGAGIFPMMTSFL